MLSSLKYDDAKREDGFTLIELLVVVIIIGILAAIAIPVFLNQRESARESAVESTLRSAATYMEIYYTNEGDTYPETVALLEGEGFRAGTSVEVDDPAVDATTGEEYTIEARHEQDNGVVFCFDSTVGTPTSGSC